MGPTHLRSGGACRAHPVTIALSVHTGVQDPR